MKEKFDLLFKEMQSIRLEMQDNQFKIMKLENKPTEKTIGDRRPNRKNHNDRRDESIHRPRDDDEIVRMIKIDSHIFNGVYDPKIFSDGLADMDYYFDWYKISEKRKVRLGKMRLTGHLEFTGPR